MDKMILGELVTLGCEGFVLQMFMYGPTCIVPWQLADQATILIPGNRGRLGFTTQPNSLYSYTLPSCKIIL
jgi:hypothetical protein